MAITILILYHACPNYDAFGFAQDTTLLKERRTSRAAGFTLIEMLAVLSIIGVVLAIVLPVLAHARARSRQTVCTSNLRQLGLALAAYAADSDGRTVFPGPWADDTGDVVTWDARRMSAPPFIDYSRGRLSPYVGSAAVFTCPAATDVQAQFTQWHDVAAPYGFNIEFTRFAERQGNPHNLDVENNPPIPATLAQVQVPAETLVLTDSAYFNAQSGTLLWAEYINPPSDKEPSIAGRHASMAQVLWFDGHVSAEHPVTPFAVDGATQPQTAAQHVGVLLPSLYTGNAHADDYYYALVKL